VSVPIPLCLLCRHLDRDAGSYPKRCTAFPDSIPEQFASGRKIHTAAYPGDQGIQFEPRPNLDPGLLVWVGERTARG
jgi:hypothetical protein